MLLRRDLPVSELALRFHRDTGVPERGRSCFREIVLVEDEALQVSDVGTRREDASAGVGDATVRQVQHTQPLQDPGSHNLVAALVAEVRQEEFEMAERTEVRRAKQWADGVEPDV